MPVRSTSPSATHNGANGTHGTHATARREPVTAQEQHANEVEQRIAVMQPVVHRPDAYEARMQRNGFAGFAVVDGSGDKSGAVGVQISKSPDGRSPSFVAEAGKPLRVLVDADLVSKTAQKIEVTWYLTSQGHTTKQRITIADAQSGARDMRTGALALLPAVIDVPSDAAGTLRLSVETTGADGRVSSSWSPHYDAVVMPKDGSTVVFDEDWSVTASAGVRAGESLSIAYDADRLRAILGAGADSAVACVSFDGKAPVELPLLANGTMLLPSVQVPFDAENVSIWFKGTSGDKTAWDSAFGKNYAFPIALPKDDADLSWKRMALTIRGLPGLTEDNFAGIGPSDGGYNCIAWSVGTRQEWVWPGTTVAAFDDLYAKHGYKPLDVVDDAALAFDPKLEKVALYGYPAEGTRPFEATHAARMDVDGTWTSKLGTDPLIRHEDPHVVEGPSYGKLARVYVRPRSEA